ncbi:homoserine O-acetyltransferase [Dacryopinax primogenitus]|uniref:Homoserine O-acetyltransferase n=1 Tax=Dacryopinax primogenitus (strain DJM 731) TaxID=1858805 RepID=M5FWG7_DACPD|nr:homoserine O-acetyltransferase [Dacryopinax primogenitus]EJU00035.1 homoserine O-acetyltransferase [Dacryopinax primogenitus]
MDPPAALATPPQASSSSPSPPPSAFVNPFEALVAGQTITHVPSFELESGHVLRDVPVAYKTWGRLNEHKDNVMVLCHAFTGSADVEDWWGPLLGPGKAFDYTRYLVICFNVMGSPYGSASPVTRNPDTGRSYGPEFPLTTIRDDVRLHKLVLDSLGVRSIAVVIGGSMGGMATLEWTLCTPPSYVRHIIPIATSARHSAWCISWGEAQRQSIYSDPSYADGYYTPDDRPETGLAAARMAALLTYRSRDSFESRFGRRAQGGGKAVVGLATPPESPRETGPETHLAVHNDGHKGSRRAQTPGAVAERAVEMISAADVERSIAIRPAPQIFSAQGYLRYQGEKFTSRFDANCYIHITRKMDTHDIARGRTDLADESAALAQVLKTLPPRTLVIGVESDGLFTPYEQREIAAHIRDSELVIIRSPDGHDGFLLEFEQLNTHILRFLKRELKEVYEAEPTYSGEERAGFGIEKSSLFGEAEADVARW